ncbi:hypothetical protein Lal_00003144 [Lupinus albus]|nr:hypothetical protein Lal_00003144 [Lupinus albus]
MANPLLTRHVLLHRLRFHHNYRSLTVAAPYRLWCNAATPTTNDLDYKEDEPIVVLTKDILHSSRSIVITNFNTQELMAAVSTSPIGNVFEDTLEISTQLMQKDLSERFLSVGVFEKYVIIDWDIKLLCQMFQTY